MKPSFSPLQLLSPIQLILCFVLFFLPWIELSCVPPPEVAKAPPSEVEQFKKETGIDPTKPIGVYSQSGLQIASGDLSVASDMEKLAEQMKKKGAAGGPPKIPEKKDPKDEHTAPLLYLFPVAVVAGIVLGFVPWPNMIRRILLAACCAGALGVVLLQAAIGFPLEKEVSEKKEQMKDLGGFRPAGGANASEPRVTVRWKFPLYLTLLLLLGAAGTSFLDGGLATAKKKSKKKYIADYDDEDEDDDRPRKKKRRAEPEDEDDEDEPPPPRKKRRAEVDDKDDRPKRKPMFEVVEDDEDEAPKKKPKRRVEDDEDDEDDRPRKKRRRDD